MPAGRPTTLTPGVQAKIIEALRKGNYRDTAAALAGVTRQTLWNWEKWGKEGKEPYVGFFDALEMAEAQAESDMLERVLNARPSVTGATGPDLWQATAWAMERRWPKKWAQRVRVAVSEELGALTNKLREKLDAETFEKVVHATREDAPGADGAHLNGAH